MRCGCGPTIASWRCASLCGTRECKASSRPCLPTSKAAPYGDARRGASHPSNKRRLDDSTRCWGSFWLSVSSRHTDQGLEGASSSTQGAHRHQVNVVRTAWPRLIPEDTMRSSSGQATKRCHRHARDDRLFNASGGEGRCTRLEPRGQRQSSPISPDTNTQHPTMSGLRPALEPGVRRLKFRTSPGGTQKRTAPHRQSPMVHWKAAPQSPRSVTIQTHRSSAQTARGTTLLWSSQTEACPHAIQRPSMTIPPGAEKAQHHHALPENRHLVPHPATQLVDLNAPRYNNERMSSRNSRKRCAKHSRSCSSLICASCCLSCARSHSRSERRLNRW